MRLNFTKMHGLGNDFVVINNIDGNIELDAENIRHLSARHTGIGCDHVLVINKSNHPEVHVMYQIFNADGNEAEQSGNGVRCLGKYLIDTGIVSGNEIHVENSKGPIRIKHLENGLYQVNMGRPEFEPGLIPISSATRQPQYVINISKGPVTVFSLSMGNPHAVLYVDDVQTADVSAIGSQIQQTPFFPQSVNVGFLQVITETHVKLRVYERGVGETMACGTGACAAAVAGIKDGKLDNNVSVELIGGTLEIEWNDDDSEVWMTGPATTVYEGQIDI